MQSAHKHGNNVVRKENYITGEVYEEEQKQEPTFEVQKHNEGTGELCPKGANVKLHFKCL
jgi:adenine/guanine phosphoribosyltransferase-like PRPP-binding protein